VIARAVVKVIVRIPLQHVTVPVMEVTDGTAVPEEVVADMEVTVNVDVPPAIVIVTTPDNVYSDAPALPLVLPAVPA